jgi:hypothetical protein
MAQSNVYSLNVVGYVNKTLTGNAKYTAVANPLTTSSNTIGGLLTASVPVGSQVLKYDPAISDYNIYGRVAFGSGWTSGGATVSLNPGEGVLIFMATGSSDATNTFVGEVMQGNLTNSFPSGYRAAGNIVPDSGLVSALGLVPPNGSQLLKWNPTIQDWDVHGKLAFGWTPSEPNIGVAESFILNSSSAFNWVRNFTVAP